MSTSLHNLLPSRKHAALHHVYLVRLGGVLLVLATLVMWVALSALFPAYLTARGALVRAEADLKDSQGVVSDQQAVLTELGEMSDRVAQLAPYTHTVSATTFFNSVLQVRPPEVRVQGMSYARNNGVVTLTGVADTRTDLVTFVGFFEDHAYFNSANLPISDLAKNTDLDFTISLAIKPELDAPVYE